MSMAAEILPGFADPVAGAQQTFRAVLDAMARPGEVRRVAVPAAEPGGWSPALAATALTLFDQETPVWLDQAAVGATAYLRFHCGCPVVPASEKAAFAVMADVSAAPPLHAFGIGDPLYPERSATLILQVPALEGGPSLRWTGPGIKGETLVSPKGLPPEFVRQWAGNHALYPSGVDVIFVADDAVMALPRGVAVEEV